MIELRPVDPVGAYHRWNWIRDGLQRIIDRTHPHYRPEDVYTRIRNGTAWLYCIDVDGDDIGFLVLTQEHDPDGLVLFVWCLWCEPGAGREYSDALYTQMDILAQSIKARRIRWESPRAGWGREHYGQQVAVVYEREVGL